MGSSWRDEAVWSQRWSSAQGNNPARPAQRYSPRPGQGQQQRGTGGGWDPRSQHPGAAGEMGAPCFDSPLALNSAFSEATLPSLPASGRSTGTPLPPTRTSGRHLSFGKNNPVHLISLKERPRGTRDTHPAAGTVRVFLSRLSHPRGVKPLFPEQYTLLARR